MEELDLHGLLHPIQVVLRSLLAVCTPVPYSMMEFVPEVYLNVNPISNDGKTNNVFKLEKESFLRVVPESTSTN